MAPPYIVILFCATAGKNGEELGADEEQIVLFVYLLYDVANNKVVALQHHYVRPQTDDLSENVLTDDCKTETGLTEDLVKNAQPLEHVLDEFDRFISSKEIHPDHGGKPFCFCVDGPLHIRLVLHPEAINKNFNLPSYFYKFYDIRNEFKKFYKNESVTKIKDMLDYLSVEEDQSVEYGVRQCQEMGRILHRLINDGHTLGEPEIVKDRLEPGICSKNDIVDDDCVVRARGLPWQSSDSDIAKFFKGLNVAKGGVALCLSKQGRRNGEALIRFDSKEDRDMALKKHKHHLKQRYIEVYKASGKDFINVAGGSSTEAQEFLSRHSCQDQTIMRMRGLPYTATAEQVLQFFHNGDVRCEVLDNEDGILFVKHPDGRATGDAFVLLPNEEVANKALTKHKQCIGTRYIELFKSTTAEVQQVLNNTMESQNDNSHDLSSQPLITQIPHANMPVMPQPAVICGTAKDCIRLRGLPFESTVTDILTFLGEHSRNIVYQGVHMVYNAQGTFSGEAFIQMNTELAAEAGAASRHKKYMIIGNKKRYIEVLQCSGEDMNVILSTGLPPPMPQIPQIPRQMMSPGVPATSASASPGMLPQMLPPNVAQFAMTQNGMGLPQIPISLPSMQPNINGLNPAAAAAALAGLGMPGMPNMPGQRNPYGYQPIMYWYPSPPVSPQSSYYVHACPTTVVLKGLPLTTTAQDIMTFFDGVFEIPPDIQLQQGSDGRPTGDAFITFASRIEAERAVAERSRKPFGNRFIDMLIAQTAMAPPAM